MSRFADLADGGRALVPLVRASPCLGPEAAVLAILPNGVPVAEPLCAELGLPLLAAALDRDGEPRVSDLPDVAGRAIIVVDDGVETGTAARLVGLAVRAAGAACVVLAVPVCPREARPMLERVYDEVLAVDQPLVRRDLRWHYSHFDTIDEAEARSRLAGR